MPRVLAETKGVMRCRPRSHRGRLDDHEGRKMMSEAYRALTREEIDEVFGGKTCLYCWTQQIVDPNGNTGTVLVCEPTPCRS